MGVKTFIQQRFIAAKLDFTQFLNRNNSEWSKQYSSSNDTIQPISSEETDFDQFLTSFLTSTELNLKASTLLDILVNADNGYGPDQASLFSTIQEKDPKIASHLQTRRLAMLSQGWQVEVSPKLSNADAIREQFTNVLIDANFDDTLNHITDALPTGYSGAVINWGAGGKTIKNFTNILPENWDFDMSGNPAMIGSDGNTYPLSSFNPAQFIYTDFKLKPGIPTRGGLMRACIWMYFFKHYAIRDRARFLEKFGTPFLMATLPQNDFDNPQQRARIKAALKAIAADSVGVAKDGTVITPITPGSTGNNGDFQKWFEYIDDCYALTILGQLATSDTATGMSNGSAQSDVRRDLTKSDTEWISKVVTRSVARNWEMFNYGTSGNVSIKIAYKEAEDEKKNAEVVEILDKAGWVVEDQEFMQKKFNMPLKKKEVNLQIDTVQKNAQMTDLQLADTKAEKKAADKEVFIANLTKNTLLELYDGNGEAMAEYFAPLKKAISDLTKGINADDENLIDVFNEKIQSFFDSYPDVFNKMEGKKMQDVMAGAFLAGMVNGNTQ